MGIEFGDKGMIFTLSPVQTYTISKQAGIFKGNLRRRYAHFKMGYLMFTNKVRETDVY